MKTYLTANLSIASLPETGANAVRSTEPMWHKLYNQFDSINEGSGG